MAQAELRFVTGNDGKVKELQHLVTPLRIRVVADDRGYPEIQADTLEEVARAGAAYLVDTGLDPPFLLEDAGLFVTALRGFPGVFSRHALDTIGTAGLLRLMQDVELESRTAAFQACIAYVDAAGAVHVFHGTSKGRIADRAAGSAGFGFDPVFIPDGETRTFAQLSADEKTALSHRAKAAQALLAHLGESAKT